VASPGMKYKHYAPKTKCVLVYSNDKVKMINKINEISKFDLKDYVESLFNHSYKIKTIKRKIAVLKTFFNYIEFDEIIEINPFRKLRLSLKVPKG
jgi:site-specific recombinase XerD